MPVYSVMVYTASGLSPILPAPLEDGDSEPEVGEPFESSTWVSKCNIRLGIFRPFFFLAL